MPKLAHPETCGIADAVRRLHNPIDTVKGLICGECSNKLPNGRYFPYVRYPCTTVAVVDGLMKKYAIHTG